MIDFIKTLKLDFIGLGFIAAPKIILNINLDIMLQYLTIFLGIISLGLSIILKIIDIKNKKNKKNEE